MKFGKVDRPETLDLNLPQDHSDTEVVLSQQQGHNVPLEVYVGCAKWNRQELKNFYPRGTKDELAYYSSQFNAIELNATFYRIFPSDQYEKWYHKTSEGFKFFPKLVQNISHFGRLNDSVYPVVDHYLDATVHLKEKLGTIFLQMHNNFGPKNWDRVVQFVERWPKEFSLALEFRHSDWFQDSLVNQELHHLLKENGMANVLVDTAGRRDLVHMQLSNGEAFIRYVGANHPTDYDRLDQWVERLHQWRQKGLGKIHFFVHQNLEMESPLLSAYFIDKLNKKLGTGLHIPNSLTDSNGKLF
jgi:uncharacterized protein YecE (DUF72 family)